MDDSEGEGGKGGLGGRRGGRMVLVFIIIFRFFFAFDLGFLVIAYKLESGVLGVLGGFALAGWVFVFEKFYGCGECERRFRD